MATCTSAAPAHHASAGSSSSSSVCPHASRALAQPLHAAAVPHVRTCCQQLPDEMCLSPEEADHAQLLSADDATLLPVGSISIAIIAAVTGAARALAAAARCGAAAGWARRPRLIGRAAVQQRQHQLHHQLRLSVVDAAAPARCLAAPALRREWRRGGVETHAAAGGACGPPCHPCTAPMPAMHSAHLHVAQHERRQARHQRRPLLRADAVDQAVVVKVAVGQRRQRRVAAVLRRQQVWHLAEV